MQQSAKTSRDAQILVHDAIARALDDLGVDTLFGLVGDANLYMVDKFTRLGGKHFVPVANEASAVGAANGYAQATGRVGVATVTHGPALTNTVTALVEAVKTTVPIVLIGSCLGSGGNSKVA